MILTYIVSRTASKISLSISPIFAVNTGVPLLTHSFGTNS